MSLEAADDFAGVQSWRRGATERSLASHSLSSSYDLHAMDELSLEYQTLAWDCRTEFLRREPIWLEPLGTRTRTVRLASAHFTVVRHGVLVATNRADTRPSAA